MKELHNIRHAQNDTASAILHKEVFAAYLEEHFIIGTGATVVCDYIIAHNLAYKLNNYDEVATFLREQYDVHPK